MKKISDERINYISGGITYQSYDRNIYFGRAVAQAQLDADRKDELIIDPDQSLPECPYSYKGWTQYEESIYKQAQQDILKRNWVKILKEKSDE